MHPVLELTSATLVRGGVRVLERLSLTVRAGEHTAILGPNGAGKTSLIRMLMLEDRPLVPDAGPPPLQLFGRASWDLMALRSRLGIVTGDLDAGFGRGTSRGRVSGLDVAVSGLFGSQGVFAHQHVDAAMREQGRTALARVEAGSLAAKPLNEMSAGERRRVLIARALVTSPDALLLDEPTTGLDFVARHRFMESVRRLAQGGTTVILVTHHVEEIIPEVGRVVLLHRGTIAADGPTAQVLGGPALPAVFGAPLTVTSTGGYYHVRVE
jgi:iron complex transport system ATP-binding protein